MALDGLGITVRLQSRAAEYFQVKLRERAA
jgi:hypothetical protein